MTVKLSHTKAAIKNAATIAKQLGVSVTLNADNSLTITAATTEKPAAVKEAA